MRILPSVGINPLKKLTSASVTCGRRDHLLFPQKCKLQPEFDLLTALSMECSQLVLQMQAGALGQKRFQTNFRTAKCYQGADTFVLWILAGPHTQTFIRACVSHDAQVDGWVHNPTRWQIQRWLHTQSQKVQATRMHHWTYALSPFFNIQCGTRSAGLKVLNSPLKTLFAWHVNIVCSSVQVESKLSSVGSAIISGDSDDEIIDIDPQPCSFSPQNRAALKSALQK